MAERLLGAGHAVTVWNRSRDKLARAIEAGAKEAVTPAEVARAADVVFVCVTDDKSVEAVVFGEHGIAAAASKDKLLIDCSTIKPDACRRLAKRLRAETGMAWIDAPVTGGVVGARAGRLVIMAGGDEAEIEACASDHERGVAELCPYGAARRRSCDQALQPGDQLLH
jgi:3-hydroxyisobutyrate dehydrogenase-like beta-hydroxyacid dehydrogenase